MCYNKMGKKICMLLFLLLFSSLWGDNVFNDSNRTFIPGMELGIGIDNLKMKVLSASRNKCLKTFAPDLVSRRVKTSNYEEVITSKDELLFQLGIGGHVQLPPILGILSIGIGGSFLTETVSSDTSVYLLLQTEITQGVFSISYPEMRDDAAQLYDENYEKFREICGDSFVDSISTGGIFNAVVEIKAATEKDKLKIAAELSGKVIAIDISVKGSLEMLLEELKSKYEIHIKTVSWGDKSGADNERAFLEVYDPATIHDETTATDAIIKSILSIKEEWFNNMKRDLEKRDQELFSYGISPSEKEKMLGDMVRLAPYKVTLKSYASIASKNKSEESIARENRNSIEQYARYNNNLSALKQEVKERIQFPQRFQNGYDKLDEMKKKLYKISWNMILTSDASEKCGNIGSTDLCPGLIEIGVTSYTELSKGLPAYKPVFPKNCNEVKFMLSNGFEDGEYQLFMGGDPNKPFKIYCKNMKSDTPDAYLPLSYTSHPDNTYSSHTLVYNFFRSTNSNDYTDSQATVFEMIRVEIGDNALSVSPKQDSFIKTNREPSWKQSFGEVKRCGRDSLHSGNITLIGTPFYVSAKVRMDQREQTFKVIEESVNLYDAVYLARKEGGTILTIHNAMENEKFQNIVKRNEIGPVWLGLVADRNGNGSRPFVSMTHEPFTYRNWNNPRLVNQIDRSKPYAAVFGERSDGTWTYDNYLTTKNRVIVEFPKARISISPSLILTSHNSDRQVFDITVSSHEDRCATIGFTTDVVLEYDRSLM